MNLYRSSEAAAANGSHVVFKPDGSIEVVPGKPTEETKPTGWDARIVKLEKQQKGGNK